MPTVGKVTKKQTYYSSMNIVMKNKYIIYNPSQHKYVKNTKFLRNKKLRIRIFSVPKFIFYSDLNSNIGHFSTNFTWEFALLIMYLLHSTYLFVFIMEFLHKLI